MVPSCRPARWRGCRVRFFLLAAWIALGAAGRGAAPAESFDQWVAESWDVRDGLPVQHLNQILQRRDGYLWIATFDGLVRFDGVRFVSFDTSNSEGLPSSRITSLHETADATLWLTTEQGHFIRYREGRFEVVNPGPVRAPRVVPIFFDDPAGGLLIGADEGLFEWTEGRLVRRFEDEVSAVDALFRDRDGTLWIGTQGGNVFWHRDGVLQGRPLVPPGAPTSGIAGFAQDRRGRIWTGMHYGLFHLSGGLFEPLIVNGQAWDESVMQVGPGADGTVWVGTQSGFFQLTESGPEPIDPAAPVPTPFRSTIKTGPLGHTWVATRQRIYRDGRPVFEAPAEIRDFSFDHEDGVWVATIGGLFRLKPRLFDVVGEAEGLAQDIAYPVLEDRDGAIWVGTLSGGMSRIGPDSITNYTEASGALPQDSVSALALAPDGQLIVGTRNSGLCRMDESVCVPLGREEGAPGWTMISAIHFDASGALWAGTNGKGLYRLDGGHWRRFTPEDGLAHNVVRVVLEEPDGTLWFGTNGGGISRYRNGAFTTFSERDGLSIDIIRSFFRDDRGALWVGTEGRGLNRITFAGDRPKVAVIRKSDGLFDEVIHQMLLDDRGRLWMNSNRGIFWVPLAQLRAFADGELDRIQSTAYTERDGLRSREGNGGMQPAGVRGRDGSLWFPTQAGVVRVDPNRLPHNDRPPRVVIEELQARGSPLELSIDGPTPIAPGQRDLEIRYTALSFQEPANVRFRYRLNGYDPEWVEAGNRRVAFYTNVPPGDYRFQVIAANNDGVWNLSGTEVALTVTPLFYERAWFLPGIGLLIVVAGLTGYRRRVHNLQIRERELAVQVRARTAQLEDAKEASDRARREAEQLRLEAEQQRQLIEDALGRVEEQAERLREHDEAKSRFFANVSHEFRTPLTLTIGPLQDLLEGRHGDLTREARDSVELARRNSQRLLGLINEILEIARLEAGQLQLRREPHDLGELLLENCRSFIGFAERQGVELSVELPASKVRADVDGELLGRVLGNLLANAFRFTPLGGRVRAALTAERPDRARLSVEDSGPGIPPDQLARIFDRFYRGDESAGSEISAGIGLALCRELVEMHGGQIQAANSEEGGAVFEVSLPAARFRPEAIGAAQTMILSGSRRPEAAPLPVEEGAPTGADDRRPCVLVVDDNPEMRSFLRDHLVGRFRVVEAGDGAEGLARARRQRPDVIVSDIMMPAMSGDQLCAAIRADPEVECTSVILLTARASRRDKVSGLASGADDYLTKPFEPEELLARIDSLLAARLRLRDRLRKELALTPRPSEAQSEDERFLGRVRRAVEAGFGEEAFGVGELADNLGISRGHLHRRLRTLLGQTPTAVIRSIRLDRAAELLGARAGTVSEIAYATGFQSVSHFCRSFKERFGCTPASWTGSPTPRA